MSVFHAESFRDSAKLPKAQSLIKMSCAKIAFHHSVELQQGEPQLFSFFQAVQDQLFPDMPPPRAGGDGIARIANVAAPPDIVGWRIYKPTIFPSISATPV